MSIASHLLSIQLLCSPFLQESIVAEKKEKECGAVCTCIPTKKKKKKKFMRWPGVEPGSTAWKATMLTVTPPTLVVCGSANSYIYNY